MKYTTDLSDAFFSKLADIAKRLDANPLDLLQCMFSESNCKASAHNPNGDASGLIQLMPATLAGLGFRQGDAMFRQLSAEQQLPWVEAFFRPHAGKLLTAAHVYTTMFLPADLDEVVGAGEGWPGVVLCKDGGKLGWAERANKVLDENGDGAITAGELADRLEKVCVGARWDEICQRMAAVTDPPAEAA